VRRVGLDAAVLEEEARRLGARRIEGRVLAGVVAPLVPVAAGVEGAADLPLKIGTFRNEATTCLMADASPPNAAVAAPPQDTSALEQAMSVRTAAKRSGNWAASL
jgi:hypothetical protein